MNTVPPCRPRVLLCLLALIVLGLRTAVPAAAEERILKYHTSVTVARDATLHVIETITLVTDKPAYGLTKTFPPQYNDDAGPRLLLLSTAIDGTEGEGLTAVGEGRRFQIIAQTRDERAVQPGVHVYAFTYDVERAVRYFSDRDELTWNATGHGWDMPISEASLQVELPSGVPRGQVQVAGHTGADRAAGKAVRSWVDAGGRWHVTTISPLGPGEGLTATLALPKGHLGRKIASTKAERIRKFHSRITVHADATLLVRETIVVDVRNEAIRHGIYRDFPTDYDGRYAVWLPPTPRKVGFTVQEATRDNQPEPFRTEPGGNGMRVYLGAQAQVVPPGEHTYTLTYQTDRQLGFFPDHDEMYWNVTGNDWIFPIEEASASIELPAGIRPDQVQRTGYTGRAGSQEQDYASGIDAAGLVVFRAWHPLDEREGLTVAVSFPKGFVREPDAALKLRYFLRDAPLLAATGIGLVLLVLYTGTAWFFVGRDPARGIILPLYHPPGGLSPAAIRYLVRMGFDDKTFVAALIALAVKGHLRITEEKGVYTLCKPERPNAAAALAPEEQELYDKLPDTLALAQENHSRISGLSSGLEAALTRRYAAQFRTNRRFVTPAIVLSVLTLLVAAPMENGDTWPVVLDAVLFCGGLGLSCYLLRIARRLVKGANKIVAAAAVLITLGVIGGTGLVLFWAIQMMQEMGFPAFFLPVAGLVCGITYVFHRTVKARTPVGAKLADSLEGFRLFLAAAEQDRLDRLNPPERTPELFERYFPYALAFDLELRWAEQFATVLSLSSASDDTCHSVSWFETRSLDDLRRFSATDFASSIGSSLSLAIASSSTAPGSSSGFSSGSGGGGSSGGGGGGGGGGGW